MSHLKSQVEDAVRKANASIPLSKQESAYILGVSRQRVDEIERNALGKVRKAVEQDATLAAVIADILGIEA